MAKKTWKNYLEFGDFSANLIFQNFSFVLFIMFLLLIYIANAHYAERKVREIQALQKDIKELRWQYMSIKSKVMYTSKQSEVIRDVQTYGLSMTGKTPKKIIIEK
jgi:Bacteriodetes cell division protein (FtsL-like)